MSEKGTGTGKAGILRMRTPDHRWIEVPYGAGQDSKIRSVNIFNGSNWVCPTFGRLLWPDMFTDPGLLAEFDSLLYRSDKVKWTGWSDFVGHSDEHQYNPTFRHHDANSEQFTFSYAPKWTRLFYLAPRTDPTYRIVPINYPLPALPPNRTLDYDLSFDERFSFQAMWPAFTNKADLTGDGLPTTAIAGPVSDWRTATHTSNFPIVQLNNPPDLTRSVYVHEGGPSGLWSYDYPGKNWTTDFRGSEAGLIDLKAIRQRLVDAYPEQDVTYTGQKHNISNQELQWVIVKLRISVFLSYWVKDGEEQPGATDFDTVVFSLRSDNNIAVGTEVQALEPIAGQYRADYHYPLTSDPQGPVIWTSLAQPLTHQLHTQYMTADHTVWNNFVLSTEVETEYRRDYPGEENIAFSTEIFNPVQWKTAFSQVEIRLDAYYDRIALGYRDYSTTFPDDLIRWDAVP